jgi:hypothetical protein
VALQPDRHISPMVTAVPKGAPVANDVKGQ